MNEKVNEPLPLDKEQIPSKGTPDPLPLREEQIPDAPARERLAYSALPATTTVEQQTVTAGQRKINIIWEVTQSLIAILITGSVVYIAINQIQSDVLTNAFFLVVTLYFVRTNHTKTGGIAENDSRSR